MHDFRQTARCRPNYIDFCRLKSFRILLAALKRDHAKPRVIHCHDGDDSPVKRGSAPPCAMVYRRGDAHRDLPPRTRRWTADFPHVCPLKSTGDGSLHYIQFSCARCTGGVWLTKNYLRVTTHIVIFYLLRRRIKEYL
ncbi:hypothetical protein EVAR_302_1 [Eumeta japonica]|uniref:Uncharacterized protein n=1 Tax=Eumeta variegata TaxID=151549 RepID=A0A4C1S9C8_EUMVA|nr:hypothetical protein EVAR_302_1 [Eumeta japonica]